DADARSDIFAFGALLFEMVTGRKAFEGKTQASLIASILERQPAPIASLQPAAPPDLDRLVRARLAKDPGDRVQSAHHLLLQIEWIAEHAGAATAVQRSPAAGVVSRPRLLAIAGGALAVGAALTALVLGTLWRRPSVATRAPTRFIVAPPPSGPMMI